MEKMDSEREKRRYRKAVEDQIRKDFEEQIKSSASTRAMS